MKSYLHLIWHNPSMPKYPSECTGGVKFKISRIPLIGLETKLRWRTARKFRRNPNLNEIIVNIYFSLPVTAYTQQNNPNSSLGWPPFYWTLELHHVIKNRDVFCIVCFVVRDVDVRLFYYLYPDIDISNYETDYIKHVTIFDHVVYCHIPDIVFLTGYWYENINKAKKRLEKRVFIALRCTTTKHGYQSKRTYGKVVHKQIVK
jgi:hypothetical protein